LKLPDGYILATDQSGNDVILNPDGSLYCSVKGFLSLEEIYYLKFKTAVTGESGSKGVREQTPSSGFIESPGTRPAPRQGGSYPVNKNDIS
jgi:hypothetical protein